MKIVKNILLFAVLPITALVTIGLILTQPLIQFKDMVDLEREDW